MPLSGSSNFRSIDRERQRQRQRETERETERQREIFPAAKMAKNGPKKYLIQ